MIFHEHRDELSPAVALPVSDNFKNLMHKEEAYEKLLSLGFEKYIPRYKGFNSAQELTDIKGAMFKDDSHFVIKNVTSYASLGFAILTDKSNYIEAIKTGRKNVLNFDDYCRAIDEDCRKISMEYLDGKEYSVDVYLNDGRAVVAVPRERTGVSNNIVLDGKVVNNETLIHAAEEITEALVTDGFINIQFMESEDGYKLTDINPRFCGSQVMSLGAEVNFPSLFIEYHFLGNQVDVTPVWNTRMLRFRDHIFVHDA